MQPWGIRFCYWFLNEVLFKSELPGAVFVMGLYYLDGRQNKVYFNIALAICKMNYLFINLHNMSIAYCIST